MSPAAQASSLRSTSPVHAMSPAAQASSLRSTSPVHDMSPAAQASSLRAWGLVGAAIAIEAKRTKVILEKCIFPSDEWALCLQAEWIGK